MIYAEISVADQFNWPKCANVGENVRIIYHMLLEEGVIVEKIEEKSNTYKIYFTAGKYDLFRTLILTPKDCDHDEF